MKRLQVLDDIRAYREKHFRLRFNKRSRYASWPDESMIHFTYNGAQWSCISLLPREAKQLHAMLEKKFNL